MWLFNKFRGVEVQRQIRRLSLGHKPHEVRAAMSALEEIGGRAVPPLIDVLLNEAEPEVVRGRAADTLAMMKDERAIEPLITTLGDRNERVRWSALKALEELGDRRAIPELQRIAASDEGEFSITPRLHVTLKEEARKAIAIIEASAKR